MPSWQVDYQDARDPLRRSTALTLAGDAAEAAGNVRRGYPGVEVLTVRQVHPHLAGPAVGDVATTVEQLDALPEYAVIVGAYDPADRTGGPHAWQKWSGDWNSATFVDSFTAAELTQTGFLIPRFRVVWLPPDVDLAPPS